MVSGKLPPENYPPSRKLPARKLPLMKIPPPPPPPPWVNFLFFPTPNFPKNKHFLTPNT